MQAVLSFSGVIFDASGLRGKLDAAFSNFTAAEALQGWPFYIPLEVRASTEDGVNLATQNLTGLASPSNNTFSFNFSFTNIPPGTAVLVANAVDSVFQVIISNRATRSITFGTNGGGDTSTSWQKWVLIGGFAVAALALLQGGRRR